MSEPAVTDERGLVYVPRRAGLSRAALAMGFTAVAGVVVAASASPSRAAGTLARSKR